MRSCCCHGGHAQAAARGRRRARAGGLRRRRSRPGRPSPRRGARTRATATSTRSCSPPTASRCATRSSATGAGWTRRGGVPARARGRARRGGRRGRRGVPRRRGRPSSRSPTRPRWASGSSTRGLLEPGDEVLTTEHDHYATHEALRLSGATVRKVALYDDPGAAPRRTEMIDALPGAITAAHEGRRGDLGALGHRRQAAAARARRRRAAGRRRRRARARRRPSRRHRRRRARRRHAQVAGRAARHGPDLDARPGSR